MHFQEISSPVDSSAAAAQSTCKHFPDTPAVQFGGVGIVNSNQQQWQEQLGLSQISRRDQDWQGHQEFFAVSLSVKQRSVKTLDQEVLQSEPLSRSTESYLSSLQTSHVPHGSCLSMRVCLSRTPCESASADIALPIGPSLRKGQEAISTPAWHHDKWNSTACVRQTNTRVG